MLLVVVRTQQLHDRLRRATASRHFYRTLRGRLARSGARGRTRIDVGAFGDSIPEKLDWKMPMFSGRMLQKTPNASWLDTGTELHSTGRWQATVGDAWPCQTNPRGSCAHTEAPKRGIQDPERRLSQTWTSVHIV